MSKTPNSPASLLRAARVYRAASAAYRAAERIIPRRDQPLRDMLIMRAAACDQYADALTDRAEVARVSIRPSVYTGQRGARVIRIEKTEKPRPVPVPVVLAFIGAVIVIGTGLAMWGML